MSRCRLVNIRPEKSFDLHTLSHDKIAMKIYKFINFRTFTDSVVITVQFLPLGSVSVVCWYFGGERFLFINVKSCCVHSLSPLHPNKPVRQHSKNVPYRQSPLQMGSVVGRYRRCTSPLVVAAQNDSSNDRSAITCPRAFTERGPPTYSLLRSEARVQHDNTFLIKNVVQRSFPPSIETVVPDT